MLQVDDTPRNQTHKALLVLLPFWTPQIPPLGISCLKAHVMPHGYSVTTVDANNLAIFKTVAAKYVGAMRRLLADSNRFVGSSLFDVANNLLQNHMLAHLHRDAEPDYPSLLREIVSVSVFADLSNGRLEAELDALDAVVVEIYELLEKYILDLLESEKPKVFGLSVYSHSLAASLFACKLAKQHSPDISTVLGGAVFSNHLAPNSPNFDFFLQRVPYVDKVIVGEGETIFLKYLQGELPPEQRVYGLADVKGSVLTLTEVGLPDYSDYDLSLYPSLPSYSSRSCPFQCSFCSETVQWGKYRTKTARQIVDEFVVLFEKFRAPLFWMCDSLLNPVIHTLARETVERGLSFYWDGYLRVDKACTPSNASLWRRGGFYRARLGVESGSQKVLDAMDKMITVQQVRDTIRTLADVGIKTTTYWVVGHPGETEEDFQQTLDIMEELRDDIYECGCHVFQFFPDGQVSAEDWKREHRFRPLFSERSLNSLLSHTWVLNCEPSREEGFRRLARFEDHCTKLGIPSPRSLADLIAADVRWKALHKNATPTFMELKMKGDIGQEMKLIEVVPQPARKPRALPVVGTERS